MKYQFPAKDKKEKESYYKIARGCLNLENPSTEILGCESNEQAISSINTYLMEYRDMLRCSFLVTVRSEFTVKRLQGIGLIALGSEMPCVVLPEVVIPEHDNNISSLDWKNRLLRINIEEWRNTAELLHLSVRQSRYSHIPLCNLALESSSSQLDTITNIMFARILRAGDNLLWWNEYNREIATSYESKSYTGRISNPGLYTSYCVEFDVANLTLNAIAMSEEQGQGVQAKGKGTETLDDMGKVQTAFEYLRKMVRAFV